LGSGLGWTAGSLLRIRRKVVRENLRIAFPAETEGWRRETARASFRHLGREGAALFRLHELSPGEVLDRCTVEGLDELRKPLESGNGVLILSGHLGNWELLALALSAYGLPLDAVAHTQSNPLFDRDVRERRGRFGMQVIPRSEGTWKVLRSLQKGRAVLLFADQRVINGGIMVDFFGIPTPTARGPAVFALRTGVRVVLAPIRALPGRKARYRMDLIPLPVERSDDSEADVRRLTRRYLSAMEDAIRRAPEQYFWVHNRWKGRVIHAKPGSDPAVPDLSTQLTGSDEAAGTTSSSTRIGDPQ
jgi:KDO2-lipid IV(A) lauroyltransferase